MSRAWWILEGLQEFTGALASLTRSQTAPDVFVLEEYGGGCCSFKRSSLNHCFPSKFFFFQICVRLRDTFIKYSKSELLEKNEIKDMQNTSPSF